MTQESHGFLTREEWTKWFLDYNLVISGINDSSYELIQSDLPFEEWIAQYQKNSVQVREAYHRNEEILNWHVRWFTRTPGRWTREVADPLLATLFRYVSRVQDLGTTYELSESLLNFYKHLGDKIAMMKCYMIRAFSCDFLDPIHLSDSVYTDCLQARSIYEHSFYDLTPEEQSMGLSIYDLEFDWMTISMKLGRATPEMLNQMIDCYTAAIRATEQVLAVDQGYDFNTTIPDFNYCLSLAALCLPLGLCTPAQTDAIYQAAQIACETNSKLSQNHRIRSGLVYRMAQRLKGLCPDDVVLEEIRILMKDFAASFFTGSTYDQYTVGAIESIQLATENLTHGGKLKPKLYSEVQQLFVQYFSTRPYTVFVDYVCATYSYCYILTSLPHITEKRRLLKSLLKLTMFRQVQTAIHSIMVGNLAVEVLDSLIRHRPELLVGQLGTTTPQEVQAQRKQFFHYLYCGALLHDIGKLLCSSVINAQSHHLGDLEFQVLKFHPITGEEMLKQLPALSMFRDIIIGHHKSYDGTFGYPMKFDNTASTQKIMIDIITVCDSLDAATDHLGRNYATAKDYETVMGELRAGRGTRYSGEIVDQLDTDEKLKKRTSYLLEEGRWNVYYHVHKMLFSEFTFHMDQKKTHQWLFNLDEPAPYH